MTVFYVVVQLIKIKGDNMKKRLFYSMILVAFAIILYLGLSNTEVIAKILKGFFAIIFPLILGLCIAFIVNVFMRILEKFWMFIFRKAKKDTHLKAKRPVCLVLSILVFIGLIFALIFMLVPQLVETTKTLIEDMPEYISNFNKWWSGVVDFAAKYGATIPEISFNGDKASEFFGKFINDNKNAIFDTTIGITTSVATGIVDAVLGISFSIYILAEKEKFVRWCKKISYAYLKEEKADTLVKYAKLTNQTFTNFITGQFIEAIIIGVLCFIGMSIFRMPYASIISVLVGATALIPVLGAYLGTGVGAFLILLVNPVKALIFVVFIIVLQQLEGNLIYPKVVGKSVGLPGILVLAAVTIGGKLFGVAGMLIGVPTCAVLYCIIRENVGKQLEQKKLMEKI